MRSGPGSADLHRLCPGQRRLQSGSNNPLGPAHADLNINRADHRRRRNDRQPADKAANADRSAHAHHGQIHRAIGRHRTAHWLNSSENLRANYPHCPTSISWHSARSDQRSYHCGKCMTFCDDRFPRRPRCEPRPLARELVRWRVRTDRFARVARSPAKNQEHGDVGGEIAGSAAAFPCRFEADAWWPHLPSHAGRSAGPAGRLSTSPKKLLPEGLTYHPVNANNVRARTHRSGRGNSWHVITLAAGDSQMTSCCRTQRGRGAPSAAHAVRVPGLGRKLQ
jgi:hypothetical protein